MKPRKIMSRHHATSSQRGRTSLNGLIILFFTSDWFKPVRTCVTWSFSSLSRIRAGWMILQVCTWSQADRQTKRRSGLIISLCGSPEGESPARAPLHMQMVETPPLRGPPPIKNPPSSHNKQQTLWSALTDGRKMSLLPNLSARTENINLFFRDWSFTRNNRILKRSARPCSGRSSDPVLHRWLVSDIQQNCSRKWNL